MEHVKSSDRLPVEPIAVIGMACRFPGGANDLDSFWRLLMSGTDASSDIPSERWDPDIYFDPLPNAAGKSYARRASFIQGVDLYEFDAEFFGVPPVEARALDPQQRLLLEVAWEAAEHACLTPEALAAARAGVFLGTMNRDYDILLTHRGRFAFDSYCYTGTAMDVAAGRLSYFFDLHGPNLALNTACSSSLVALHLGCQSLRNHECGIALVGGVNVMLTPDGMVRCCRMHAISPDGRSKAFDVSADGFGRGEGCGVVVLKPLADAQRDGDRVLAVIRATAVRHDGRGTGLTVPNAEAQEATIIEALTNAGVEPARVSYLEAHGTGTPVGDPIEIRAAGRALGKDRPTDQPLKIASVKTNIGHLEGAAGIAGLIKTILALQHRALPAHLHLRELNPALDLESIPAEILTTATPWTDHGGPLIAGVNSFGMGGTSAFALLEEAPQPLADDRQAEAEAGPWLLPISARSQDALRELAGRYRDYLNGDAATPPGPLRDVCYVAGAKRTHHRFRKAVTGANHAELAARLGIWLDEGAPATSQGRPPGIAFIYSGQGSQWAGMGRQLLAREPVFREAMQRCDEAMRPYLERSMLEMLVSDEAAEDLARADRVQPAIFAMQVALTALWRSWGVEPQAVVGHSMAEISAAYVAGVLTFEDAVRLTCLRSRIQYQLRGRGGMIAVGLSAEEAERLLVFVADRVCVGVHSSPRACVLSGDLDALARIEKRLVQDGVFCRRVQIDGAAHSYHLDPYLQDIREVASTIKPGTAKIPMYSTVTGDRVIGPELDAEHWVRNLRHSVLFSEALQRLAQDGHSLFLEVSPHPVLVQPTQECLEAVGRAGRVVPSLRRGEDERGTLLASLGVLYEHGQKVAWPVVQPSGRPLNLPAYPWQRQRHWDDSLTRPATSGDEPRMDRHPLLQRHLRSAAEPGKHFWEVDLDLRVLSYLGDHKVRGGVLFPGAGYIEAALAAASQVLGAGPWQAEDVRFEQGLFLSEDKPCTMQLVFTPIEKGVSFRFFSEGEADENGSTDAAPQLHASGVIRRVTAAKAAAVPIAQIRQSCHEKIDSAQLYRSMAERGLYYGPAFQGVSWVEWREGEAVAGLQLPDAVAGEWTRYGIHPALFDAGLQVAAAAVHETAVEDGETILPVGIDRVVLHRRVATTSLRVVARGRETMPSPDGLLHADLLFVDGDGDPVVEVQGLTLRRLAASAAARDPWSGWFYELQWQPHPADDEAIAAGSAGGPWLLLADENGLADAVRASLEARGERCITVSRGAAYSGLDGVRASWDPADAAGCRALMAELAEARIAPTRVIYFCGLDVAPESATTLETLHRDRALMLDGPLHLIQAIEAAGLSSAPQLVVVTRGAQQTPEDETAPNPAAAPLWGLARTVAQEHPELRPRRIDLNPAAGSNDAAALLNELNARAGADEVALRPHSRYEMRLAPVRIESPSRERSPERAVRADGTYLVTGGLGGLGLVTAEWLADEGAGQLLLMGRSAPSEDAQAAIARMTARGTKVVVVQGDVTREADLVRVLESAGDRPLRGVFHSAGVLDDAPLVHATALRGARVMAPKIDGSWILHERTLDRPLDFFVLYSSVASMLGFAAQGSYAAGNAFMDALAQSRRAAGRPGLSVNWGPWSEVGLAAKLDDGLRHRMAAAGLRTISPIRGRWALDRMLMAEQVPPQVGVFRGDWARHLEGQATVSSLLRDVPRTSANSEAAGDSGPRGSLLEALERMPVEQWRDLVSGHVAGQVAKALGYLPTDELDADVGFFDLGMDSLRAVDLRNALQASTGLTLRSMVAFEHPTIRALSEHLMGQLSAERAQPA